MLTPNIASVESNWFVRYEINAETGAARCTRLGEPNIIDLKFSDSEKSAVEDLPNWRQGYYLCLKHALGDAEAAELIARDESPTTIAPREGEPYVSTDRARLIEKALRLKEKLPANVQARSKAWGFDYVAFEENDGAYLVGKSQIGVGAKNVLGAVRAISLGTNPNSDVDFGRSWGWNGVGPRAVAAEVIREAARLSGVPAPAPADKMTEDFMSDELRRHPRGGCLVLPLAQVVAWGQYHGVTQEPTQPFDVDEFLDQ